MDGDLVEAVGILRDGWSFGKYRWEIGDERSGEVTIMFSKLRPRDMYIPW